MIGAITMLARVIGFGRQVVFAHTVQAGCLGTAYTTANMVPNIIYDIVMGGAVPAVVVPVLGGPARGAARRPRPGPADLGRPAQLDRAAARPDQRGGGHRRAAAALGAARRGARVPADGHGRPWYPDAHRVRAADPAVRPGRGAVRHLAGAPQVRRPRAGSRAV